MVKTAFIAAIVFVAGLYGYDYVSSNVVAAAPAATEAKPAPDAEITEAKDIVLGSMMESSTSATTCSLLTVVAPQAEGWWARLTSNRDLSISSVSNLAAGATVAYPPVYDEAGFAIGLFGANPTIQLREHGGMGARVLFSGTVEAVTKELVANGYSVGLSHGISCHFDWDSAKTSERYEILLKARESVKKEK